MWSKVGKGGKICGQLVWQDEAVWEGVRALAEMLFVLLLLPRQFRPPHAPDPWYRTFSLSLSLSLSVAHTVFLACYFDSPPPHHALTLAIASCVRVCVCACECKCACLLF